MRSSAQTLVRGVFATVLRLAVVTILLSALCEAQRSREDLSLIRSTFFGQSNNIGYLLDVTTDAQGYVYGTGWCTHIQTTVGVYGSISAGRNEVMVFKLDPSLSQIIWSTYIGGSADDGGGSIVVNAAGEVIVSGYTQSPNFPVVNGFGASYLQTDFSNAFVLKLSPDGSQLLFSSILGRIQIADKGLENAARGAMCCLNSNGNIYVLSQTRFPYSVTANALGHYTGGVDMVISKLSNSGSLIYSSYCGGYANDYPFDFISVQNRIYICGTTGSPDLPNIVGTTRDVNESFVMLLDDDGTKLVPRKSYVYGTTNYDAANGICYDPSHGRLMVCGVSYGLDFKFTTNLMTGSIGGGFVTTLDTGLTTQGFVTLLGTRVVPRTICCNLDGSIYVGSYVTRNERAPISVNAFQTQEQGGFDAALTCLDSSGSKLTYGTFLCGEREDYSAVTVCLYHSGCFLRALVGLTTHSENFPSTPDALQPFKLNGDEDQPALCLFSTIEDVKFVNDIKICEREINASISAICTPTQVVWDFGDGTPQASGVSVRHIYQKSGTYIARVKVSYWEPDTVVFFREIEITGPLKVNAGEDQVLCGKDSRTKLQASGAVKYSWTPAAAFDDPHSASPTVNPTKTTEYYLRGIDVNGCVSDDTVIVYISDTKVQITSDTLMCGGTTLPLHVSGGTQYNWLKDSTLKVVTPTDVLVSPKKQTTYRCVVVNGNCTDTATVTISVKMPPILRVPVPQTICPGVATELKTLLQFVAGGDSTALSYQWTPLKDIDDPHSSHPIVTPRENRWYKVEVLTSAGCVLRDSVFITMRTAKVTRVIADTGMCQGESVVLWAQGADSYRWTPAEGLDDSTLSAPRCTATRPMEYIVYTSNGPCPDTHRIRVDVRPRPKFSMMRDTTICRGATLLLNAQSPSGSYQYRWWPANGLDQPSSQITSARPYESTTYYLAVSSSPYCEVIDSVRVSVDSTIIFSAGADQTLCPGERCTLDLGASFDTRAQYTLEPPVATFDVAHHSFSFVAATPGYYVVHASKGSCTTSDTMLLRLKTAASLNSVNVESPICKGSTSRLELELPAGVQVHWLRGNQDDSLVDKAHAAIVHTQTLDRATDFHIRLSGTSVCDYDTVLSVLVVEPPRLQLVDTIRDCAFSSLQLALQSDQPVSCRWTPSIGLSSDTVPNPILKIGSSQTYKVSARNREGCQSTAEVYVEITAGDSLILSLDSARVITGEQALFHVRANARQAVQLTRDLLMRCRASSFEPEPSYKSWRDGDDIVIELPLHGTSIAAGESIIASIQGRALFSTTDNSTIGLEIDSSHNYPMLQCLQYSCRPGYLETQACLSSSRHIELRSQTTLQLQPNPVSSILEIQFTAQPGSAYTIHCFNTLGAEIFQHSGTVLQSLNTLQWDLSNQAAGVYSIRLECAQETIWQSVVKTTD